MMKKKSNPLEWFFCLCVIGWLITNMTVTINGNVFEINAPEWVTLPLDYIILILCGGFLIYMLKDIVSDIKYITKQNKLLKSLNGYKEKIKRRSSKGSEDTQG